MREGRIVDEGPSRELFDRPRHPYTAALAAAIPRFPGGPLPGDGHAASRRQAVRPAMRRRGAIPNINWRTAFI